MSFYISGSDTKSNLALWRSSANPANGTGAARPTLTVQSSPTVAPRVWSSGLYTPFVVGKGGLKFGYLPGTALAWGEMIVDGTDRLPRATPLWTLPLSQQTLDANREAAKAADVAQMELVLTGTVLGGNPNAPALPSTASGGPARYARVGTRVATQDLDALPWPKLETLLSESLPPAPARRTFVSY